MKQFAVIGNPVDHSMSPTMFSWLFKHLDINANYRRIQIEKSSIIQIIIRLRNGDFKGLNVTLPFKEEIIHFLDIIHITAQHIQAVNCIVREENGICGYNTDEHGFDKLMEQNQISTSGNTFVLLGAGGAARSILYTLIQKGVETVIIVNRTPERSISLVNSMSGTENNTSFKTVTYDKLHQILPENAVIINCTPIGMTPNIKKSPFPPHLIHEKQILIDTIYTPLETQFLKDGKAKGAQTAGGLEMFIHQGLASLDLWFTPELSKQVILEELRDFLKLHLSKRGSLS